MARFLVPQPVAGFLIGTGGARTKQYSERSGAKVWVAGQQFVDVPGMRCVPASLCTHYAAPGTQLPCTVLASAPLVCGWSLICMLALALDVLISKSCSDKGTARMYLGSLAAPPSCLCRAFRRSVLRASLCVLQPC